MATTTKILADGTECIRVIVQDEENEVRVHIHIVVSENSPLHGLLVKSSKLGLICELGNVVEECDG